MADAHSTGNDKELKQAEAVVRQSEEALKVAQRIAHLGSWHMDLATNEVYWSEELYKMYGFDPALPPPLYTESMKLFTPDSWERLSNAIAHAVETGISYELELEMVPKQGGTRWMLARGELVRDDQGKPVRMQGVVMDITERKLAERKIRESEQKFKAMTDTSPLAIYMSSGTEQKAEYINPRFTELFGYTLEEVPSVAEWWPLAYPDEEYRKQISEEWNRKVEKAIQTSTAIEPMEVVVTCKDGSKKNISWGYISTGIQNWAFGLDQTESKQTEKVLRESEERLALATLKNGVGIWDWNLDTQKMIWDDSMFELYHIRREDFVATEEAWRAALHPDDLHRGDKEVQDAIAGIRPFETEFRVVWPNGEIRHIKAVAKVFRDEQGSPVRMLGINMDVTERKRAEAELLEKERHSQSLLRLSRAMERSQSYAEILNAAQEEVRNILGYKNLWVYLFTDDRKYLKSFIAGGPQSDMVMSEEGTATLKIEGDRMLEEIASSKEIVLVEDAFVDDRTNKEIVKSMGLHTIVNIPIMIFDRHMGCVGTGTIGDEGIRVPSASEQKFLIAMASHMAVALDRIHLLVARKKSEAALLELNTDFVTLLENTGDFIYFKDKDSRIRFCSQTLANITGHQSWRDMVGKHDKEIFPADTAQVYYEEELPIFRDGIALLNKTDPYYDAQGNPGWVSTNKWPVFDAEQKTVVGIFGISRDVTELKQAEDKITELNRDLEQRVAERTIQLQNANDELESFSYSVSHDLRTPLRAIDGFSRILLDEYNEKLDDEGKRLLNIVRDNTSRMGQLIDDILQFSRTGRLEMNRAEIDMEALAQEVYAELPPAHRNANMQLDIAHLPAANGDRAMLRQVFSNLISNAIKFSGHKDAAKIEIGFERRENETVYFVKDNGAGFDMQYADKLFGVFQRLHDSNEFEGTGIGLAIVKRIITRHGGRVWARGLVNEGATVYFTLPVKRG